MFEILQDKIEKAFHILKGKGKITEINISETLKKVRRALINADVSFKIANNFINKVKKKSLGTNVIKSLNPDELIVKLIHDELIDLMGGDIDSNIILNNDNIPNIILIIGTQGSGKTTFSAKLANYLKNKKNKNPLLASVDIYRPAAINQLKLLANKINIPIHFEKNEIKNILVIIENSIQKAINNHNDVLIIDTAGRIHTDDLMMNEIKEINKKFFPKEILLVLDSMVGQDSINIINGFKEILDISGVVLTKLDSDTRGGVALTVNSIIKKPIKFISTGEKLETIDVFHPKRMADRILGMGDVISLVERAQEQFDKKHIEKLRKKIAKNSFNFNDLLKQIQKIKKMGSLKEILGMIPGMSKSLVNFNDQIDVFKKIESIIYSMTYYERENPKIINNSRKKRISKGSGISLDEVNKLLKQFSKLMGMMKNIKGDNTKNILNEMLFKKHFFQKN